MRAVVKKSKSVRKTHPAAKAVGDVILRDLTEFAETLEAGEPLGSKYTVRRVAAPMVPGEYNERRVRATRDKIAVSQAIFAQLLGVSTILVQAWEQGNRVPAPWARRLLDEVNRDPNHWRQMVKRAS